MIDEAHKIFDRMPSFRPAFDSLKKLQQLLCTLAAMSATLTSRQIEILKDEIMHGDKCCVLTEGVHRDNLLIRLSRYLRQKQLTVEETDEAMDENEVGDDSACSDEVFTSGNASQWSRTVQTIEKSLTNSSTII